MIKRIILLVAFMTLCVCSAFAQYSLCRRVGPVIDSAERAYFGLFPNVEGFVSATASQQEDGRVAFTIKRTGNTVPPDTTFTIDSAAAYELATFIEDFESFRRKPNIVNWETLDGLADYGHVYDNRIGVGLEAIIESRSGETLQGLLLFVNDSSLVLLESSVEFSYRDLQTSARRLRLSDVEKIIIEQEGGFWTGFGFGALIGGAGGSMISTAYPPIIIPATLIGAAVVGLIGGTIGAINSIDTVIDDVWNVDASSTGSDKLRKYSLFTTLLPPELVRFVYP